MTEGVNVKRKQLEDQIYELDKRIADPASHHLTIVEVDRLRGERAKLHSEFKALPPGQLELGKIRVYSIPKTIRSKDSILEIQYINNEWKVTKFSTDYKHGEYGKPRIILDENGLPTRIEYEYRGSDTQGEIVTAYNTLTIDEPEPVIMDTKQEPLKFPDNWICSKPYCGTTNSEAMLVCSRCGTPRDNEKAKSLGPVSQEQPKNDKAKLTDKTKKVLKGE
jgi:hypothetical protein